MGKFFNFKSIKSKFMLSFSLIFFLWAALAIFIYVSMDKIVNNTEEILQTQLELLITDSKLAENMPARAALLQSFLISENNEYREQFESGTEKMTEMEQHALEISDSPELEKLLEQKAKWEALSEEILSEYDSGDKEAAMEIMVMEAVPLSHELMKEFQDLADKRGEEINQIGESTMNNGKFTFFITTVALILTIGIGSVVSILNVRNLTKPLRTLTDRVKLIAGGNLTAEPFDAQRNDEIGELMQAANEMNGKMKSILEDVMSVADQMMEHSGELARLSNEVKSGSQQVATAMQELASGADTQANRAADISSTVQSFMNKIKAADENGAKIDEASKEVLEMANAGSEKMETSADQIMKINHIVRDSVQKMNHLNEMAKEISNLVTVVKEIADQTNLLALNAAIEAARAGEHGRGFAVVADEVGKLAEQVAVSVTNISEFAANIQKETKLVAGSLQTGYEEVEAGTKQVQSTNKTFRNINHYVNDMADRIHMISESLAEINENSMEITGLIKEIAAVTEQSAANIEETSALTEQTTNSMDEIAHSSSRLAKDAGKLNDIVRRFIIH